MNLSIHKFHAAVILAIVTLSLAMMPRAYSAEKSAPDEVLVFLEDVIKLDVSKYDATLSGTSVKYPDWLGGLPQMTGKFILESKTSKLDVLFKFRNTTLSWCLVRVREGSPFYTEPLCTNLRDVANDFLQKYQEYSDDPDLTRMKNMLDTVDVTKNITITSENVKLGISVNTFSSEFYWKYTFNGADYSGMGVSFRNGSFYAFSDDRSYYKVGGTDVNVSKEDAINIAMTRAENFSWTVAGEEVTDFNIVEELIGAELLTRSRTPLELYPYWLVILPLDDLYPGSVSSIMVAIWADTSEVIDCLLLGFDGSLPLETLTTDPELENIEVPFVEPSRASELFSSLPTQQIDSTTQSIDKVPIAVVAATISIAIATLAFKRKHK
jgi:hypothetical protein